MDRTIFGRLRTILAELYPDVHSIRRVLYDAGINLLHIELSGIPVNAWHSILDYAEKQHMIEPLLNVVRSEYGSNVTLRRICDDYLRLTSKAIEPEVEER